MAEEFTYYGIFDVYRPGAEPTGVFRRSEQDGLRVDEAFTRRVAWEQSPLLLDAENGDLTLDFHKISAAEADRIVERIRANAPYDE